MASTDSPVGAAASILAAVKAQTMAVQTFMGQQVGVYTSQEATTQVTDADGNPYTVPTWHQIQSLLNAVQTQVAGLGSGGGGGGFIEWDGKASQVATPFGIAIVSPVDQTENYTGNILPALDSTSTILTADGTTVVNTAIQEVTATFAHKGFFPATGKYWVILEFDNANIDATQNYLEFTYQVNTNIEFKDLSGYSTPTTNVINLQYLMNRGTGITVKVTLPGQTVPTSYTMPVGVTNLLVTFDFDAATMSVYADQLIAHYVGSGQTTFPNYWAMSYASGDIDAYAQKTTVTFNVTDATKSPIAIPTGFSPLATVQMAVPPQSISPGTFVESSSPTIWNGNPIQPNQLYVYGGELGGGFVVIPSISSLPQLAVANQWGDLQKLNYGWYGSDSFGNTMLGVQFQNGTPPATNAVSSSSIFINAPDPTTFGSCQSSVVMGAQFNSIQDVVLNSCFLQGDSGNNAGYAMYNCVALGNAFNLYANSAIPTAQADFPQLFNMIGIGAGAGNYVVYPITTVGSQQSVTAQSDIFLGSSSGQSSTLYGDSVYQTNNVFVGPQAGSNSHLQALTTAIGYNAGANVNMGATAGSWGGALFLGPFTGNSSTVSGNGLTLIGAGAGKTATFANNDTILGANAGTSVYSTGNNTLIGAGSGTSVGTSGSPASLLTAVGYQAMASGPAVTNATALGANSQVTASNQVQLGNSACTTYAYGAVQDRSDIRDKAEVRDTVLGLAFINSIRAVDFKWDMRDDYIDRAGRPVPPALSPEPIPPSVPIGHPDYIAAHNAHYQARLAWIQEKQGYDAANAKYQTALMEWQARNNLSNLRHDGSKKRGRFHHGVIAQEVKAQADKMGVDFGGFQDHSVNGGEDVCTVGYGEFIAPIIKAIQEVDAKFASKDHINKVVDAVVMRLSTQPAVLDKIAEAVAAKIASAMDPKLK